jgi:hypothetical protein
MTQRHILEDLSPVVSSLKQVSRRTYNVTLLRVRVTIISNVSATLCVLLSQWHCQLYKNAGCYKKCFSGEFMSPATTKRTYVLM